MKLTTVLEIDLEKFVDEAVIQYPEDVKETLLSHYDSIGHLIGELEPDWFIAAIDDKPRTTESVSITVEDFKNAN